MDIIEFTTIVLRQLQRKIPPSEFEGEDKFEMTVGSGGKLIKIFYDRGLWGAAYMESQEYIPFYHVTDCPEKAIEKAIEEMKKMSHEDKEPTMTVSLFLELLSANPNMNMI